MSNIQNNIVTVSRYVNSKPNIPVYEIKYKKVLGGELITTRSSRVGEVVGEG